MNPPLSWPEELPCVQWEGKSTQVIEPTVRTSFANGRSRARRAFEAVPVEHEVKWRFNRAQAALFEDWFRNTLKDGVNWFNMELPLPQGDGPWPFQFKGIYSGPELEGTVEDGPWVYSATLIQFLRASDD